MSKHSEKEILAIASLHNSSVVGSLEKWPTTDWEMAYFSYEKLSLEKWPIIGREMAHCSNEKWLFEKWSITGWRTDTCNIIPNVKVLIDNRNMLVFTIYSVLDHLRNGPSLVGAQTCNTITECSHFFSDLLMCHYFLWHFSS